MLGLKLLLPFDHPYICVCLKSVMLQPAVTLPSRFTCYSPVQVPPLRVKSNHMQTVFMSLCHFTSC